MSMRLRIMNHELGIMDGFTVVFLFLLPWQTRLIWQEGRLNGGVWEYGTLAIYATEILIWTIVLTRVVAGFSLRSMRNLKATAAFVQFARIVQGWWLIAVGVGYVFLSALWAPAPRVALFGAFHAASALVAFCIIRNSSLGYKKITAAFVGGAVAQAILGIGQMIFQWVPASTFLGMATHDPASLGTSVVMHGGVRFLRAYGGLPHPNILGGYLAVALLVAFFVIVSEIKQSRRIILCAITGILAIGLFFTFSRGAWIGFFFSVVATGFSLRTAHNLKFLATPIAVVGIIFVVCGFLFRDTLAGRFVGDTPLEKNSITERVDGFQKAFAVWRTSPLLGVGIGNYTARLAERAPGKSSWSYQPVHNAPLLVLAELGIVGFILLVFCLKKLPVTNYQLPITICLVVIFLFDHYLWSLYPGILLVGSTLGICRRSATA